MGLSGRLVGLAWLAGPISGIVMQPVVGVLSDRCRSSFGRRRPFMLVGAILVAFSLVLFAFSGDIARLLGDPLSASGGGTRTGLAVALGAFWTLDFAINALQSPTRALLADVVHPSQLPAGNACFAVANGVGKTLAYTLGTVAPDIRVVYAVAAGLLLVLALLPALFVRERALPPAPEGEEQHRGACSTIMYTMREVSAALHAMPRSFRRVFAAQLLSYVMFMLVFIYVAIFFGQLNGGRASAPPTSAEHLLFDAGVLRANRALLFMSILSMVVAPVIPALARILGTRLFWGGSLFAVGVALVCTILKPSALVAELVVISVGLPLSNAMTIPWSITALYSQGELARQRGLHFAVFNLSQAIPGLFASFLGSLIVTVANGNLAAPLVLAGVFSLLAAIATIFVDVPKELRASHHDELDCPKTKMLS